MSEVTIQSERVNTKDTVEQDSPSPMAEATQHLHKAIKAVSRIQERFTEILYQSNLLMMDAGDAITCTDGTAASFPIVAEKIRNFVLNSTEAAKDITKQIEATLINGKNEMDFTFELSGILSDMDTLSELVSGIMAMADEIVTVTPLNKKDTTGQIDINAA